MLISLLTERILSGNINQYNHYGEQYGDSFIKLKLELPYDFIRYTVLGIYPEKAII